MAGTDKKASGSIGLDPNTSLDRGKSEYRLLNSPYGMYNTFVNDSGISKSQYKIGIGDNFFKQVKASLEISLSPPAFGSNFYYGIVLKIENATSTSSSARKKYLEKTILGTGGDSETSNKEIKEIAVRVRVPELHANLTIPSTYPRDYIEDESNFKLNDAASPDAFGSSGKDLVERYDALAIQQYPIFYSRGKNIPVPQIGSLVMVELSNPFSNEGTYLGVANLEDAPKVYTENIYSNSSLPFDYTKSLQQGAAAEPAIGNSLEDALLDAGEEILGNVAEYLWEKAKDELKKDALDGDYGKQVAKYAALNSPFLQKQGANFYSSNGGFVLQPRSTLAGITQKVVDEKGRLVHKDSKILNRGIYKVQTEVKYIKNVEIKPKNYTAYSFSDPLYALTTNKVRPYSYGDLGNFEENLVQVQTVLGKRTQKLHILAAERIKALNYAWLEFLKTSPLSSNQQYKEIFKVSKGHTPNKYNDNYKLYVKDMTEKYGSLENGMKFEPFHTSYETGLVFDFGNNGLIDKNTNYKQNKAWQWLVNHAYLYGIYPSGDKYNKWEVKIPRENWFTGIEFVDYSTSSTINGKYYKYCVYVVEESINTGRNTSDKVFENTIFE